AYGSNDHDTSGHNVVIYVRRGVLAKLSMSNESSTGLSYNMCGSIVQSTFDHTEFDHFKRGERLQAAKSK
ncbi:hypothetical protein Tco_1033864, partial [Tanacetum coccineum]